MRKHVLSNSGSDDDVYDVFQESIIVLYNLICDNKLDLSTQLKGYFFGIARNIWSSQLRKKQRTVDLVIDLSDEDDSQQSDQTLERIMARAFDKLPSDQQYILKLFAEGISYEEISIRMNLNSEEYARRKKYLSKEALVELIKADPEYQENFRFLK